MSMGTISAVAGAAGNKAGRIREDRSTALADEAFARDAEAARGIRQERRQDQLDAEGRQAAATRQSRFLSLAMSNPLQVRNSGLLEDPEFIQGLESAGFSREFVLDGAAKQEEESRFGKFRDVASLSNASPELARAGLDLLLPGDDGDLENDELRAAGLRTIESNEDLARKQQTAANLVAARRLNISTLEEYRLSFPETGEPDPALWRNYQLEIQTGREQSEGVHRESTLSAVMADIGRGRVSASRSGIKQAYYARGGLFPTENEIDRALLSAPPPEVPSLSDPNRNRVWNDSKNESRTDAFTELDNVLSNEERDAGAQTNAEILGALTKRRSGQMTDRDRTAWRANFELRASHAEYYRGLLESGQPPEWQNDELTNLLLSVAYAAEDSTAAVVFSKEVMAHVEDYFMMGVDVQALARALESTTGSLLQREGEQRREAAGLSELPTSIAARELEPRDAAEKRVVPGTFGPREVDVSPRSSRIIRRE